MSEISLYIATNDPARALLGVLGCSEADRPGWCAIITDPDLIDRLPDGVRAIGIWFGGRFKSEAEKAWRERRSLGGIVGMSDEDLEWIERFIERRDKRERELAFAHMADRIDRPEPDSALETARASVVTRIPEDFRAMALSQRWM
jgi:hypothetical protein